MKWIVNLLIIVISSISYNSTARANSITMSVDSITRPEFIKPLKNYVIHPLSDRVSITSLQFLNFAKVLEKALLEKQWILVEEISDADAIIFLGYGVRATSLQDPMYHSYIFIDGVDIRPLHIDHNSKSKKIFETEINSTSSLDDLRKLFPHMIESAKKYIGSNTHGKVHLNVNIRNSYQ